MAIMRLLMTALLAVLCALTTAHAQTPRQKLALVIGNGNYDGLGEVDVSPAAVSAAGAAGLIPDLANPVRDAALVRDALVTAGFAVRYVENADYTALNAAVVAFMDETRHLGRDSLTVFYFAGHGVTVDGRPYLIPVGFRMPALPVGQHKGRATELIADPLNAPVRAQILSTVATPVSLVLSAPPLSSESPRRLIILDNCRDNPWIVDGSVTGLNASGMPWPDSNATTEPGGLSPFDLYVIAYAASTGAVAFDGDGAHSPFALALSQNIPRPSITISRMLDDTKKAVRRATRGRQTPVIFGPAFGTLNDCIVACAPSR